MTELQRCAWTKVGEGTWTCSIPGNLYLFFSYCHSAFGSIAMSASKDQEADTVQAQFNLSNPLLELGQGERGSVAFGTLLNFDATTPEACGAHHSPCKQGVPHTDYKGLISAIGSIYSLGHSMTSDLGLPKKAKMEVGCWEVIKDSATQWHSCVLLYAKFSRSHRPLCLQPLIIVVTYGMFPVH